MLATIYLTLAISICVSPAQGPAQDLAQSKAVVGWASQYAKGVFPRVVQLRQRWGQLPKDLSIYDGFVATSQCSEIGDVVWLRPLGSKGWETFLVADCASRTDSRWQDGLSGHEWMTAYGILVEIDFRTAAKWETLGRGIRVELAHSRPPGAQARRSRWRHFEQYPSKFGP